MIILKVDPTNPDPGAIKQAADSIRSGKLVIFPTETVYGLSADALNESAVRSTFDAKGRVETHPLPVQVAGVDQLDRVAEIIPPAARALAEMFWPGPLTLVLKKAESVSEIVTAGTGKVGVRVPDHPVALALLRELNGPIVASSANISGEPAATTAEDAAGQLGDAVSVVLDSGETAIGVASTVVDVTTDPPQILRHGAITDEDIKNALAGQETDNA